jgi:hypothetical protein
MIRAADEFQESTDGRRMTFRWNVGGQMPDPDQIAGGTYRVRIVLVASHCTYSKQYEATLRVERLYFMGDGGEMVRTRIGLADPEQSDVVWLFREPAGRFSRKRLNEFAASVATGVRRGELGVGTLPGRTLAEAENDRAVA